MAVLRHTIPVLLALLPAAASAHPGHLSAEAALAHPATGLDHVLAAIAIGLLAGRGTGLLRAALPATFIGALIVGAALAGVGGGLTAGPLAALAAAAGLAALLLVVGRLPAPAVLALAGGLALIQGGAHGPALLAAGTGGWPAAGFVLTTLLLVGLGAVLGGCLRGFTGRAVPPPAASRP